jgi:hypothetical protein
MISRRQDRSFFWGQVEKTFRSGCAGTILDKTLHAKHLPTDGAISFPLDAYLLVKGIGINPDLQHAEQTEPFLLAGDCAAPVVMTVLTVAKRTLRARIVDKIAR